MRDTLPCDVVYHDAGNADGKSSRDRTKRSDEHLDQSGLSCEFLVALGTYETVIVIVVLEGIVGKLSASSGTKANLILRLLGPEFSVTLGAYKFRVLYFAMLARDVRMYTRLVGWGQTCSIPTRVVNTPPHSGHLKLCITK